MTPTWRDSRTRTIDAPRRFNKLPAVMKPLRPLRLLVLLFVLCGTVGCDQTTKHFARTKLNPFDSVMLLGGFGELRLAENPGAFLSLGDTMPPAMRMLVFTGGAGTGLLTMLIYLLFRPGLPWLSFAGISAVLAGGLGNLIDRILRHGLVTDFITLHCGPFHTGVFNIADVLVMIGMALLVGAAWQSRQPEPPANVPLE